MSKEIDLSHPSQDSTSRFAIDFLLREYGFEIFSRRDGSPPLWRWEGKLFTQKEALDTIPKHEVIQARAEERMYRESK